MRRFNQESFDYDLDKGTILNSPRFNKFEFKTAEIPPDIKKTIISYVENFQDNFLNGIGLYFYSNSPGSGKTTILALVLKNIMLKGYRVYCDSLVEIKSKLKKEFDTNEVKLVEFMKNVDVLAIDDIGSEVMSNWLDEVFKELLDHRYNKQKPTLFTSNSQIDFLPFAARSKDRLKEISLLIKFPEKSLRKPPII